MTGLAADAAGTSLVVCDGASSRVHVLRWPLNAAVLSRRTLVLPSWKERRGAERLARRNQRAAEHRVAGDVNASFEAMKAELLALRDSERSEDELLG